MGKDAGNDRERREECPFELTEEAENRIAQKAADLMWESVYQEIGKVALRVILLVAGTLGLLGFAGLFISGKIKLPL